MAKFKEIKQKSLSIIDTMNTILMKYPNLSARVKFDEGDLGIDSTSNPFPYLMTLFKKSMGYNVIMDIISKFITYQLPVVEIAMRGILVSRLTNIFSCSVNPFLTEKILKYGVVLNLRELDVTGILNFSPFDYKLGQYYYFDTENCTIPDDLINSKDMDALIWYMVNVANKRHVWKLNEETPLVTLEYAENTGQLKDFEGNDFNRQTPFGNCLHVLLGDATEKKDENYEKLVEQEEEKSKKDEEIKSVNSLIEVKEMEYEEAEMEKTKLNERLAQNKIIGLDYQELVGAYDAKLNGIKAAINAQKQRLEGLKFQKEQIQYKLGSFLSNNAWFSYDKKIKGNYWYGHTLLDFNIAYIAGLRFFDAKTLTAKLMDSITGVLDIDMHLSWQQQLVRDEVKKMVSMIVESDDTTVSDCFFTFSNSDYDEMYRQAELRKAGLLSLDGNEVSAVKLSAEKLLSSLNEIDENTNQETVQSIIKGTLTEISKELSSTTYDVKDDVDFDKQMRFIEHILDSLAVALVNCIMSPKVFILLLMNLQIVGEERKFNPDDIKSFIDSYKEMITDLIRSIRDQLLDFLVTELMGFIGDMAKQLSVKLTLEQTEYYMELIKSLLDCYKRFKGGLRDDLDFTIDNVDYADIENEESSTPPNADC